MARRLVPVASDPGTAGTRAPSAAAQGSLMMDGDEELYAKHADELIRFATSLVGPTVAADVVADAVVRTMSSSRWPDVTHAQAGQHRQLAGWRAVPRSAEGRQGREAGGPTTTTLASRRAPLRPPTQSVPVRSTTQPSSVRRPTPHRLPDGSCTTCGPRLTDVDQRRLQPVPETTGTEGERHAQNRRPQPR